MTKPKQTVTEEDVLRTLAALKTSKEKDALLSALANREKVAAINRFNPESMLFKEQLAAFNDPSKRKVVVCSRRSGKSYLIAVKLLHSCLTNPNTQALYVGLTKGSARNVIYDAILDLINEFTLPCDANEATLTIKFKNRSRIMIEGAKDSQAVERIRGIGSKLLLAVIDEAQSFPTLFANTLVSEIIAPALQDRDGELILAGTPDPLCRSVLYQAWKREKGFKDFQPHHWNITKNVKFPRFLNGRSSPDTYLEEIKREKGYKDSDPSFRREYLGEFVEDANALVYGFDPEKHTAETLPEGPDWNYIVSADLGFNDSDAVVVLAFSYTCPVAYFVDAFAEAKEDFTAIAEKIKDFNVRYKPVMTIVDPGGGGKKFVEELNARYGIRSEVAEKFNPKVGGCVLMANDFRRGNLKVINNPENQLLIAQLSNITYLDKVDTRTGETKRVVPDGKKVITTEGVLGDDLADASLYCFKYARNYLAEVPEYLSSEERTKRKLEEHKKKVISGDMKRLREEWKPKSWF